MLSSLRPLLMFLCVLLAACVASATAGAAETDLDRSRIAARLKAAYPEFVSGIDGTSVVFLDGTRLLFDDGKAKSAEERLADPDIDDMFRQPYPWGASLTPPEHDSDPGRARNAAFFSKIYGDCRKPGFARSLARVAWLPKRSKQTLLFTTVNGAAKKLQAVSDELDALPSKFDVFLVPSAGTYICRPIAGTNRLSAHGYGIAIDIGVKRSDYWRWNKHGANGAPRYRNEVPEEIVKIFEKHGFIWGGRWYHYDTMHFEYRPELVDLID
ncbi:hypothetical protein DLM45_04050 [Hyphomicrobium methylovorum]|uniref:M15 family metallopeptidase n=1 Tax=Hyphomicrobium methylovorum TaxID=84 RepID=UPI0015E70C1A|nr:M15 family metallopeptidase [Hyphomicrobium methylovorum]MBA2125398.1 hypothetical protein [Hyphomicrobium methylovorum]